MPVSLGQFTAILFSGRGIPAWIALALGLLLTALLTSGLEKQRAHNAELQFALHVQELTGDIEKRLRDHEQILLGGAGLFDVSGTVNRAQWQGYIERLSLEKRYPGIQGVGFSQVIQPEALADHIAAVRAEGFPDYQVRPEGDRNFYTAIVYLEPFVGRNLAAFGYDMYSEPLRREAMALAVNNNRTTISGKVTLVQETHGKQQAGILMYVPVYHPQLPLVSEQDRWQALLGFVYSPYRVDDLMQGILGSRNFLVDFTLHDGQATADEALMYDSAAVRNQPQETKPSHLSVQHLDAYGRVWTITLRSRPEFQAQFTSPIDWLIPSLGAGISLLLFILALLLLSRRELKGKLIWPLLKRRNW